MCPSFKAWNWIFFSWKWLVVFSVRTTTVREGRLKMKPLLTTLSKKCTSISIQWNLKAFNFSPGDGYIVLMFSTQVNEKSVCWLKKQVIRWTGVWGMSQKLEQSVHWNQQLSVRCLPNGHPSHHSPPPPLFYDWACWQMLLYFTLSLFLYSRMRQLDKDKQPRFKSQTNLHLAVEHPIGCRQDFSAPRPSIIHWCMMRVPIKRWRSIKRWFIHLGHHILIKKWVHMSAKPVSFTSLTSPNLNERNRRSILVDRHVIPVNSKHELVKFVYLEMNKREDRWWRERRTWRRDHEKWSMPKATVAPW